jgi:hypothetical protein
MGQYLLRGGFLIVDDFRGSGHENFRQQLKSIFPDRSLKFRAAVKSSSVLIFPSCFPPLCRTGAAVPGDEHDKAIDDGGHYNNDLSEYWEWSDILTCH